MGPSGPGGLDTGSGGDRYHASLLHRSMTAWIATAAALSQSPQTPVWKRGFERNVRTQKSCGWCTSWYVSSACTVPCSVSTWYASLLRRMLLVTRHGLPSLWSANFVLNNTPRSQIYKTGQMDTENSAEVGCVCKILFSLLLKTLRGTLRSFRGRV